MICGPSPARGFEVTPALWDRHPVTIGDPRMVAAVTLPAQSPAPAPAVLFDLDGVLVDSLRVVERAWRRWAAEQHLEAGDVLARVHGRRAADVVRMFAPRLDPVQQVLRITGYETEDGGGGLTAIPGARECVDVARQGRWAVVTSGGRDLATLRLAAVGLPVPEVLVTGDDVEHGKPDPEPYLRAAALLGAPAGECVVVEDAPTGILAGKQAGMTVLAVATSHPAAALTQADLVFADMGEVTRYLRGAAGQVRSDAPRV
jgi:sugar-phosphatase